MSSSSSALEKRCYYEVLELPQTCTQDEIRSSYKKLALQRHPDKLVQSGLSTSDATSSFQELRHAYEVLSDPKERSWYDSHRSQILYSPLDNNNNSNNSNESVFPDLFSYFSASCYTDYKDEVKGFYKVYGDVFDRIYRNEVNYCRKLGLGLGLVKEAPLIGVLGSDYTQVTAFYGYWLGFTTVMDFGWVSKWDAMLGENRRSRRLMEEENKKVRKKARREFNDTVRGLAEFVKKRDKRVIDMGVLKEKEREKKRAEEVMRRKEREREKMERARKFEEPEWTKIVDEEVEEEKEEEEGEKRELYCAACGKKFKSDKQWKNHEQSRKHKDRVAELRRFFETEDGVFESSENGDEGRSEVNDDDDGDEGELEVREGVEVNDDEGNDVEACDDGFLSAEDDVDDLGDNFGEGNEKDNVEVLSNDEGDELNEKFTECVGLEGKEDNGVGNVDESNGVKQTVVGSEEDVSVLEGMVSGRRRGKRVSFKDQSAEKDHVQSEEETEGMEYNNKKGKKKSRRAKKDKGKAFDGANEPGEGSKATGSSNVASDGDEDDENLNSRGRGKAGKKGSERKSKRDAESKPKKSSRGSKQKDKDPDPRCEKCGEEFDSRNQLYKHLSDTGHASVKSK